MKTSIVVSYETAKLLKDTKLNSWQYSSGAYASKDQSYSSGYPRYSKSDFKEGELKNPDVLKHKIYAPHQHLVQKWLREKHDLQIEVKIVAHQSPTEYTWSIFSKTHDTGVYFNINDSNDKCYPTYEKALEVALQEAIKIIKKQEDND